MFITRLFSRSNPLERRKPCLPARQAGFAVLSYLLIAIFLTGMYVALTMQSTQINQRGLDANNAQQQLLTQAQTITARLQLCAGNALYAGANNGQGVFTTWPVLKQAPSAVTAGNPVGSGWLSEVNCPQTGDYPSLDATTQNARNLWNGVEGLFLPPPPRGFEQWVYAFNTTSTPNTITLRIRATDLTLLPALPLAVKRLGAMASLGTTVTSNDTLVVLLITK